MPTEHFAEINRVQKTVGYNAQMIVESFFITLLRMVR